MNCQVINCASMNLRHSPHRAGLIRTLLALVILGCAVLGDARAAAQEAPNIAALRKQAKDGDAEAQFELAKAYLSGNGVAKDSKQGAEWLEKAAKLDHPAAQQVLSYFCLNGGEQNIPKNPKVGLEWLRKSADHGNAVAEYSLGQLYLDGNSDAGVSRNPHEAATWFRKAARQPGSTKSQSTLDEMLQQKLISRQEANWRAPERASETGKSKAAPFTVAEIETGLKGSITNKRMATLVQKFGVDFKLNPTTQKRLADDGADADLLQTIASSVRSL